MVRIEGSQGVPEQPKKPAGLLKLKQRALTPPDKIEIPTIESKGVLKMAGNPVIRLYRLENPMAFLYVIPRS